MPDAAHQSYRVHKTRMVLTVEPYTLRADDGEGGHDHDFHVADGEEVSAEMLALVWEDGDSTMGGTESGISRGGGEDGSNSSGRGAGVERKGSDASGADTTGRRKSSSSGGVAKAQKKGGKGAGVGGKGQVRALLASTKATSVAKTVDISSYFEIGEEDAGGEAALGEGEAEE